MATDDITKQDNHEPTFFVATVIRSLPVINALLVQSAVTPSPGPIAAYCAVGNQDFGADVFMSYIPGTSVLCCRYFDNNYNLAYVVCPLNLGADMRLDYAERRAGSWLNGMCATALLKSKTPWVAVTRMLETKYSEWIKDRSHEAPIDTFMGDYDIRDRGTFAGLRVGRGLLQLQGSPASYIELDYYNHAITAFAKTLNTQTLTTEAVITKDYTAHNIAMSINEALGGITSPGMIKGLINETESLVPAAEDSLPLYRMQRLSGAAVQGVESLILDTPRSETGELKDKHTAEDEPSILAKTRQDIDGSFSRFSAKGFVSAKTATIPGIHQVGYGQKPDKASIVPSSEKLVSCETFDDLREPYTIAQEETTDEQDAEKTYPDVDTAEGEALEDAVTNAAVYRIVDGLLSGGYKQVMLEALAKHGLFAATKDAALSRLMPDASQISGPTTQAQYPLPANIQLIDPATGETRRYFDSTSFISQEPDGSICICDGYGSEIRMSRGNIYISPALDLQLRPGRDLSAMAGRHQSYNSQDTCTINSGTSIYVRAVGDLKIAGATGRRGVLSIDCQNVSAEEGCGLYINSTSTAVVRSTNDMYITSGHGVLIEGTGYTYVASSEVTFDTGTFTALASIGENGSVLQLTDMAMQLLTQQAYVPCTIDMQPYNGPVQFELLRGKTVTYNSPGRGSIIGPNQIWTHGAITTNGIISLTYPSTYALADLEPSAKERGSSDAMFSYDVLVDDSDYYTKGSKFATTAMAAFADLDWSIMSRSYAVACAFAFPDYNVSIVIPAMVWQTYTGQNGGTWNEVPMNDTWVYPGKMWEAPVWSVPGNASGTLNGGYIINVRK